MKINGIYLEDHGSGYLVTVRFFVGRGEELEPGDIARLVDVAKEAARSRGPNVIVENVETPEPQTTTEDSQINRRRRQRGGSPTPTEPSAPAATETSRRRRSSAASATSATTENASTPAASDAPSQSPGRRRRAAPDAKPQASTTISPSSKITNADLAKACSEAARVLTPKGVLEILAENKWASTNDIPDDRRRSFLARLEGAVSRAGK